MISYIIYFQKKKVKMYKLNWKSPLDREKIKLLLNFERLIVGHSDTVIGLFAPLTLKGVELLNDVKCRSGKPYLVLAASAQKALNFVNIDDQVKIKAITDSIWPGPVTLICNAASRVPDFIAPEGKIALRVPGNPIICNFLEDFDGLFSTSANLTNGPVPESIDEIHPEILKKVDAVVVLSENKETTEPSAILDCTGQEIVVVRGKLPKCINKSL